MPHTQIAPLERLLHCCQYTHGDEHIEEAFQILWQHPHLIRARPFDSISRLNPIAKAAISRFRATTKSQDQATLKQLETQKEDWLIDTIASGQYHPDMLINILRWESAKTNASNKERMEIVLNTICKARVDLAGSPALLRVLSDLRGQLKLPADLQQALDDLVPIRPSFPTRR